MSVLSCSIPNAREQGAFLVAWLAVPEGSAKKKLPDGAASGAAYTGSLLIRQDDVLAGREK
jgi:hypothetical protein